MTWSRDEPDGPSRMDRAGRTEPDGPSRKDRAGRTEPDGLPPGEHGGRVSRRHSSTEQLQLLPVLRGHKGSWSRRLDARGQAPALLTLFNVPQQLVQQGAAPPLLHRGALPPAEEGHRQVWGWESKAQTLRPAEGATRSVWPLPLTV